MLSRFLHFVFLKSSSNINIKARFKKRNESEAREKETNHGRTTENCKNNSILWIQVSEFAHTGS